MRRISGGSPFEATMGYSRAVVKGGWCFVSGVTGYDYATMTMPEGIAAQGRNCFATIARVLEEAGFTMADIVRVQYTVTDAALVEALVPVLGDVLGEIEVTAFKG
ncbi:RidA family protein [Cereibacter sphaeroides]|nr:RidA family protein [Cereibacter sphaeroides]